jgi:hypothetical protein
MASIGQFGNPNAGPVQRDLAKDLAVQGLLATTPTTASSATNWNVDLTAGEAVFYPDDHAEQFDAQADFDVYTGGALIVSGQSAYARIVVRDVSGALSLVSVVGTAAATGSEVEPTDAEVQTAVGATVPWYDVALVHLALAGTFYTQTQRSTSYRTRHVLGS